MRGARAGDTLFCPVSKDKTTLGDVADWVVAKMGPVAPAAAAARREVAFFLEGYGVKRASDDDCQQDKVSDYLSYTSAAPCSVRPPRPDRTSKVSVRTFSGRLFNLSVALETETVSALKRRVAKAAGVPAERQRLILEDGRCLRGEEALLEEQGIRDGGGDRPFRGAAGRGSHGGGQVRVLCRRLGQGRHEN